MAEPLSLKCTVCNAPRPACERESVRAKRLSLNEQVLSSFESDGKKDRNKLTGWMRHCIRTSQKTSLFRCFWAQISECNHGGKEDYFLPLSISFFLRLPSSIREDRREELKGLFFSSSYVKRLPPSSPGLQCPSAVLFKACLIWRILHTRFRVAPSDRKKRCDVRTKIETGETVERVRPVEILEMAL